MKKLLTIIAFIGLFQGQALAQSHLSNYYEIKPNPAIEGQMVTIGFLQGCRHWEDHSFNVNGFVIDYEVTYYDCLVGVPTPESFQYIDLGVLPAGNYQVNMTIGYATSSPAIIIEDSFSFGVLQVESVPVAANLAYWFLLSLTLLLGVFFLQRNH